MPNIFDTANVNDVRLTNVGGSRYKIVNAVLKSGDEDLSIIDDLKVSFCDFREIYLSPGSKLKYWLDNGIITYTLTIGSSEINCSDNPATDKEIGFTEQPDGILTEFTLNSDVADDSTLEVKMDGVQIFPTTDFTKDGPVITLTQDYLDMLGGPPNANSYISARGSI